MRISGNTKIISVIDKTLKMAVNDTYPIPWPSVESLNDEILSKMLCYIAKEK